MNSTYKHYANKELIESLISELRTVSSQLSVNQRLFAAMILRNLKKKDTEARHWILNALGFIELPEPDSPAHMAVIEVSSFTQELNQVNNEYLIACVSLLKALDQYEDLLSATVFLQKASDIFKLAAKDLDDSINVGKDGS
jgi:hypothetical protein